MKKYISAKSLSKDWYQSALKRTGRYACYDDSGRHMLATIGSAIKQFPNCEDMIGIPKKIRDMNTYTCRIVCYYGTLDQLQKDVCKIIRDTGKLEGETLSPRISGNQVRYRSMNGSGNRANHMTIITFTKITLKVTEKYDFDIYKLTL